MVSSSLVSSEEIDRLFEHYLRLLHQYDALRTELCTLQSSIQQNLARANFDAQRGIRYGSDLYDQRMQAARLCRVTMRPETGTAVFELGTMHDKDESDSSEGLERGANAGEVLDEETTRTHAPKTVSGGQNGKADAEEVISEEKARTSAPKVDAEDRGEEEKARTKKSKDPIRMFGILTPQTLRLAQAGAIKMVEELVPKLGSVDAEMKEIEIKIRRARKYRAKAEALYKADETSAIERARGKELCLEDFPFPYT